MSEYSTAWKLPGLIKRGETQTRSCPIYLDDTLTSPDGGDPGTYTLYDETGTKLIDAQAVTIASDIATYEVQDADVPATKNLSERYLEVWNLKFDIGDTLLELRRDCHLVLDTVEMNLRETDLTDLHSELLDWKSEFSTSWQTKIDAAWVDIQRELLRRGKRPWLVISSWALFDLHRARALELVFRDCHAKTGGGGEGKYKETADHYAKELARLWGDLTLAYDQDQDGFLDGEELVTPAEPVVMAMKPGRWR